MKGKQLAILFLVVAVLGSLWYLAGGLRTGTWSETGNGGGKVVEFPLNDVAQIVIASPAGDLHLVKKADEWTVQERAGYPADFEAISTLLRNLNDLKRVQVVKVGPSQLPRLELVEPGKGDKAGTLVQLLGADGKQITAVLLGKKYLRKGEGGRSDFGGMGGEGGMPAGRYVKRVGGETVSLVSQTFDDANPKPERWISKDFVKIDGPKTITATGSAEAQRWSITRDSANDAWKLADAKSDETIDTSKVSAFNGSLPSLSFTDVLAPDAKIADPATTVNIATFDGFQYELKIGPAQGESYPVLVKVNADLVKERSPGKDEKPEDKKRLDDEFAAKQKQFEDKLAKEKALEGRPYLVAKSAVAPLTKDRGALLAAKPAAPAPSSGPASATSPVIAAPALAPTGTLSPAAPAPTAAPAPAAPISVVTPPVSAPTPPLEAAVPPMPAPAVVVPPPQDPTPTPAP